MRKSKIDVCEYVAGNDHTGSLEEDMIEKADLLEPSNAKLDNVDEYFFWNKTKNRCNYRKLGNFNDLELAISWYNR